MLCSRTEEIEPSRRVRTSSGLISLSISLSSTEIEIVGDATDARLLISPDQDLDSLELLTNGVLARNLRGWPRRWQCRAGSNQSVDQADVSPDVFTHAVPDLDDPTHGGACIPSDARDANPRPCW